MSEVIGNDIHNLVGVLVLDKPARMTSMQAVAHVRGRAGRIKTGHAGTLDPLATGVLVLALGRATKWSERLMATEKGYLTTIDLSAFTASCDRESELEPVEVATPPDVQAITDVLRTYTGRVMQAPPAFSAMKVGGRRAYTLARAGKDVQMQPRPVEIYSLEVVSYSWPQLTINIRCGKGMYVRSLARDIGVALGTGGHLASLRRTLVGPFTEDMAVQLVDVPDPIDPGLLMSLEKVEELLAGV